MFQEIKKCFITVYKYFSAASQFGITIQLQKIGRNGCSDCLENDNDYYNKKIYELSNKAAVRNYLHLQYY